MKKSWIRRGTKKLGRSKKPHKQAEEELDDKSKLFKILPQYCEIQSEFCDGKFIYPCHRYNRSLYKRTYKGKLWDLKHVISGCTECHMWMDRNKERREGVFMRLRGDEKI